MISWDIVTTLYHCNPCFAFTIISSPCGLSDIPSFHSWSLIKVSLCSGGIVCVKLSKVWACNDQVILYTKVKFFEVSPKGLKDGVVRHARWLVCHHLCGVS